MKDSHNIEDNRIIKVFLDEEVQPFAEFAPPVKFVLDTTKIPDGKHQLKIVAKSSNQVEGVKLIPFEVKNGPEISVIGLKENEVIDTQTSIIINAYGSETNDKFIIRGSENPKAIPSWIWALLIVVFAFGLFYFIMYWKQDLYESFF
ncbi:cytochrome C [Mesonia sp. MT50]|uniref:Cytochrome C n=1 Tax=Mesonia profundi TaxID=3070998 RepID=A0ABU1A459_9FLAO|nr:cytochrome C [Mesonia profundi]MDQ7918500.1 cytochrome C [Mesonia profundi]